MLTNIVPIIIEMMLICIWKQKFQLKINYYNFNYIVWLIGVELSLSSCQKVI